MAKSAFEAAIEKANAKAAEVNNDVVNEETTSVNPFDIVGTVSVKKDFETILKECLAQENKFKLVKGLKVRNVVVTSRYNDDGSINTRCSFNINGQIYGNIIDENNVDNFGVPVRVPGMTNIVTTSAIALSGQMKNSAETALFASDVAKMCAEPTANAVNKDEYVISDKENIANILFAGGTIDVLCEYVAKGEKFANPFSNHDSDTVADRNMFIQHVVGINIGELGKRKLEKML